MVLPPEMEHWICPNDRQLTLRAKLGTGWSFHTGRPNRARTEQLTGEELDHIVRVVKRSELLEETEQKRIGCLVDRLENMRGLASGNGTSQCVLCAHEFSILGRKSSSRCDDCKMAVCAKCGVDTFSPHFQHQLWLCKICSENRELWKRSGAWFYKSLPRYILPKRRHDSASRVSAPAAMKDTSERDSGMARSGSMQTTWTRVRPRRTSSSDSEYSLGVANEVQNHGEPDKAAEPVNPEQRFPSPAWALADQPTEEVPPHMSGMSRMDSSDPPATPASPTRH